METITLYESGSTNGYKIYGGNRFFRNKEEAEKDSNHPCMGGYGAIRCHSNSYIHLKDGNYYLENGKKVFLAKPRETVKEMREAALAKLTEEEIFLLGL